MDRETKEDQDRRLILPRTPCANLSGPKLLDCLYTADAMALDRALPKSYQLFRGGCSTSEAFGFTRNCRQFGGCHVFISFLITLEERVYVQVRICSGVPMCL